MHVICTYMYTIMFYIWCASLRIIFERAGMDSEWKNSSYGSVQDDFCSPTKSSVEGSLHYLQQVNRNCSKKSVVQSKLIYIQSISCYLHPTIGTPDVRLAISIE